MLEQKDIEMIRDVVEEELNKHLNPIEKRLGSIDWRIRTTFRGSRTAF